DEKKLERRLVTVALLGLCQDRKATQPVLLGLLDDGNVYVRAAAVAALEPIRPSEALPRLTKLLDSGDPREPIQPALFLIADLRSRPARDALAGYLKTTLEDAARTPYLQPALQAFEQVSGREWTTSGTQPESYYRQAALTALRWWKTEVLLEGLRADF